MNTPVKCLHEYIRVCPECNTDNWCEAERCFQCDVAFEWVHDHGETGP